LINLCSQSERPQKLLVVVIFRKLKQNQKMMMMCNYSSRSSDC